MEKNEKASSKRFCGQVKMFDENRGFGFIESEDKDLFFHVSDVADKASPKKGDTLWYEVGEGNKGQPAAKKLSTSEKAPIKDIYEWAYIPFDNCLPALAEMALTEDWRYREKESEDFDEFGVLRSYIRHTFTRLSNEQKIIEGEKFATFNTGLVDKFYEPIYALFERNHAGLPEWKWRSFCVEGQGGEGKLLGDSFKALPQSAKYFEKLDDIYFDADAKFTEDANHIVLDGIKQDRYPHEFLEGYAGGFDTFEYQRSPKKYLEGIAKKVEDDEELFRKFRSRLTDAIKLARRRARWNYRAVVPQYYPKHDLMSFLLPLALMEDTKIDAALVVQPRRIEGALRYQGYTIFPLAYAYRNARLVAKPISDWLDQEKILGA